MRRQKKRSEEKRKEIKGKTSEKENGKSPEE